MSNAELPRLLAVFLVIFDDVEGAKVAFEVPEGSVASSNPSNSIFESSSLPPGSSLLSAAAYAHRNGGPAINTGGPLFHLETVRHYLVPKKTMGKHLITICTDDCKVLGFPVWIHSQDYPRGHFIFNVCFVFERDAELRPYEPIVRKTGRILRHMEESTRLLSNPSNELRLHSMLEQIYEDLGSYSETSIPLDASNSLDLKLFPSNPNPPFVRDWDIPVALISLDDMKDRSWDITLFAMAKYIDGTKSVKRIANLADVDLPLARECIQHLLFYGCVILHDLFQYTNSYALIGGADSLASMTHEGAFSQAVQAECESYVALTTPVTPFASLFKYYAKLRPALTIREWIEKHNIDTRAVDIRRLISFGLIKGFLRRIQVYLVWLDHPSFHEVEQQRTAVIQRDMLSRGRPSASRPLGSRSPEEAKDGMLDTPKPTPEVSPSRRHDNNGIGRDETPKPRVQAQRYNSIVEQLNKKGYPSSLPALLNGEHNTDEICIRYRISYQQLMLYLAKIGRNSPAMNGGITHQSLRESLFAKDVDQPSGTIVDTGRVKLIYA